MYDDDAWVASLDDVALNEAVDEILLDIKFHILGIEDLCAEIQASTL